MKPVAFLSLVEIRTKAASVIPFLIGTLFAWYRHGSLNPLPLVLFFMSLLCFDMFTTGLNNRQDHRRARKREGFNFDTHNAISHYGLTPRQVDVTLSVLLLTAIGAGLLLVLATDWVVLLVGMLAFGIGFLYSAGPLPLSRTPLGEAASGLAMGFVIPFLAWWIHAPHGALFSLDVSSAQLTLTLAWRLLLDLLLVCVPPVCCIANIMLANNLCDMDDDLANHRYTLPVIAGRVWGMRLFHLLYLAAFGAVPLAVLTGAVPWPCLLVLAAAPKVLANLSAFRKQQTKKDTFGLSVINFLVICLPFALLTGIGKLLDLFASGR